MANAKRDQNYVPTLLGVSNADGVSPVTVYVDPTTHRMLVAMSGGTLAGLSDVTLTSVAQGDLLYNNGVAWVNLPHGTNGQYLQTQGMNANPQWATVSAGSAAGSNTQVQYNSSGSFAGSSGLTFTVGSGNLAATLFNNITLTAPASTATLTLGSGKTIAINNSLTLAGTDATTMTFPSTSATIARTDAANTFTGHQTIEGVTSTGATGTGNLVFSGSPSFTTPTLGAATATSINGLAITTTTGTLTIASGKTLVANNSLTLAGTDSTTMTFPATSATIARTDAANTFIGTQTFTQVLTTSNAITATSNAATIPITSKVSTVTNNSAATLTITLTTTSATDGQIVIVRVLDFSAVAETITWVNTENSMVSVPTTSNGSTTLPLTVAFQFNTNTTKWRCIAYA